MTVGMGWAQAGKYSEVAVAGARGVKKSGWPTVVAMMKRDRREDAREQMNDQKRKNNNSRLCS